MANRTNGSIDETLRGASRAKLPLDKAKDGRASFEGWGGSAAAEADAAPGRPPSSSNVRAIVFSDV